MEGLLKFITCGSVDDGKSTLIGHMLYDAKLLFADQKQALELDSKAGSAGGELDYSLLLDGLMAEREQGITIDVAYRYFATQKRSFIVADTPGHEEYTRNMAVGASFADLAIILIDVTKGVLPQTRRHTRICSLMGIRDFVFAVNKMDLIDYDRHSFDNVVREIKQLIAEFNTDTIQIIPVSATKGDNITESSFNTAWYKGYSLLSYLELVKVGERAQKDEFILPIQRVCRPDHTFRGFQGQVEAGCVSAGDILTVLPGKETAAVKSIIAGGMYVDAVYKGQPVTIQLDREVDVSRGSVLIKPEVSGGSLCKTGDLFNVSLLWTDNAFLIPGREYYLKVGTKTTIATVQHIKYKIDVNNGQHVVTEKLCKNEIASCDIKLMEKVVFAEFEVCRALGEFILIDRVSNATAACGRIEHSLRRSDNVLWQKTDITRDIRSQSLGQKPKTIWFTGLSGSGKSTLANEIEKRMIAMGKHTMLLDGDNIRHGLNCDLGFKETDRVENIRRIAEVAKLMNDAGIIVLTSFISPYAKDRESAKRIIGPDFIEIHVSTPLEVCVARDVKGLYKLAYKGEIPNFTGVSSPYEPPVNPDIEIDTSNCSIDEAVDYLMRKLESFIR